MSESGSVSMMEIASVVDSPRATELTITASAAGTSRLTLLVGVSVFISGMSSLAFQVLWQRVLTQEIGIDALSMAIIVCVFLSGLGIGSLVGGRIAARNPTRLSLIYAASELVIGLFGLTAIPLIRQVNSQLAQAGYDSLFIDLTANLVLLLPPTALMGLTMPVILTLLMRGASSPGKTIGVFYGLNTLGASLGALVTGFVLIEWAGIEGAARTASCGNLIIAILFAGHGVLHRAVENPEHRPANRVESRSPALSPRLALAATLLGFITLSYEVVFFRILSVHYQSHVYVFPLMLSAFLFLLGLGDILSARLVPRFRTPRSLVCYSMILAVGGALSTTAILHCARPPWLFQGARTWLGAIVFVPVCLTPILFQAAFFPPTASLATAATTTRRSAAIAALLFWYTVGNVLGCGGTAFFLLEHLGSVGVLRLCMVLVSLPAALLGIGAGTVRFSVVAWCAAFLVAIAAAWSLPEDYYRRITGCTEYREGREGVVTLRDQHPVAGLQLNGAPCTRVFRSINDVKPSQYNLAPLRVADPSFVPRRVLIIGLGHGALVHGLDELDCVEQITIVELSPEVVDFVRRHSDPRIRESLIASRVRILIMDGRRYLQQAAARGETYDLIQLGTLFPDSAGSANLYSRDFLQTAKKCLRDHGYLMTLDCDGIAPTAQQVFVNGFLIEGVPHYAFFSNFPTPVSGARDLSPSLVRALTGTSEAGDDVKRQEWQRSAVRLRVLRRNDTREHPINSDDSPTLEFRFLREWSGTYRDVRRRLHRFEDSHFDIVSIDLRASAREDSIGQ